LRHGLLARIAMIDHPRFQEEQNKRRLSESSKTYFVSMLRVGILEILQVERIAFLCVRLARTGRCEAGHILSNVLDHRHTFYRPSSSLGIEQVETAISQVRTLGDIAENAVQTLLALNNLQPEIFTINSEIVAALNRGEEPNEASKRLQGFLEYELRGKQYVADEAALHMERRHRAEFDKKVLPQELSSEKISRYEREIERQYYRAIEMLEHMQARRKASIR
jgi:hypothetical protein